MSEKLRISRKHEKGVSRLLNSFLVMILYLSTRYKICPLYFLVMSDDLQSLVTSSPPALATEVKTACWCGERQRGRVRPQDTPYHHTLIPTRVVLPPPCPITLPHPNTDTYNDIDLHTQIYTGSVDAHLRRAYTRRIQLLINGCIHTGNISYTTPIQ